MSNYRASFDQGAFETPRPGIAIQAHECENVRLRLIKLDYTGEPRDWCSTGHGGCVLEGELRMEFEKETVIYRPGDTIAIPAGDAHKHRPMALSNVRLVLIDYPE